MISEAVEEVLNLVQDATQKFKSMMSTESEDLAQSNLFIHALIGPPIHAFETAIPDFQGRNCRCSENSQFCSIFPNV